MQHHGLTCTLRSGSNRTESRETCVVDYKRRNIISKIVTLVVHHFNFLLRE